MDRNHIVVTVVRGITLLAFTMLTLYVLVETIINTGSVFWLVILVLALLGILAISVQKKVDEKETREV
jgi:hypothetical protein